MDDDKDDSNQDKAICQIEYGPTIQMETREIEKQYFQRGKADVEEIKIQKIHHLPEAYPVDQIPDRSTQDHA